MNTSWPNMRAVLVLVNFLPARILSRVDLPAVQEVSAPPSGPLQMPRSGLTSVGTDQQASLSGLEHEVNVFERLVDRLPGFDGLVGKAELANLDGELVRHGHAGRQEDADVECVVVGRRAAQAAARRVVPCSPLCRKRG